MRSLVLAVALVAMPTMAPAQIGNPGFMSPDTRFESPGVPAPNQTNTTDRLFAQLATEGGLAEATFGELAAERAQAPTVGEFAGRMIEDHTAANDQLTGIAEKSRIPLPDALNAEHAWMRDHLEALEGGAFDLAYMRGQVVDHQKTIQLLVWEIGQGQDAELQRFAAETLPIVLDHLAAARSIVADLALAQVAGTASSPDGN
jgi:putative membrane protein